jgi:hypothetical protein
MSQATPEEDSFDPTRRRLCADGSCVGVIGDDGRCRVCGRTEEQAATGEANVEAAHEGDAGGEAGGFDSGRRLCDDGSCVGVVGDDGVCRVCGRRAN